VLARMHNDPIFFNKQKKDNLYQLEGGERGGRKKFLTRHEMKKSRLNN
jgi:hypothetical protein